MKGLFLLLFASILAVQCSWAQNKKEQGLASFYADNFHGRMTDNGELYDKDKLTAAHRTLPFGTIVRVTNLSNNKSVEVRINDRGPFIKGRIIDLSRKAAETLDIIKESTTMVSLEILSAPEAEAKETPTDTPATVVKIDSTKVAKADSNKNAGTKTPEKDSSKATEKSTAATTTTTPSKTNTDKKEADRLAKEADKAKKEADKKEALAKAAQEKEADALAQKEAAEKAKKEADKAKKEADKTAKKADATAKTVAEKADKTAAKAEKGEKVGKVAKKATLEKNTIVEVTNIKQGGLYKMQVLQLEAKGFGVQIAGYSDYETVLEHLAALQEKWVKGGLVYVDELNGKNYYKVILGPFFTKEEAASYCENFKKKFNAKDAFVVNLEDMVKDTNTRQTPAKAEKADAAPAPKSSTKKAK